MYLHKHSEYALQLLDTVIKLYLIIKVALNIHSTINYIYIILITLIKYTT